MIAVLVASTGNAVAASNIVKPGLWEVKITTGVSEVRTGEQAQGPAVGGQHPAQLPPEAHKPVVAPDITETVRECLKPPLTQSWGALTRMDRDYGACQIKPVSSNAKRYKAVLTCAGGKARGEANFNASATRFDGTVTVVAHQSSYDRTDSKILQGRWVRATCDDSTATRHR